MQFLLSQQPCCRNRRDGGEVAGEGGGGGQIFVLASRTIGRRLHSDSTTAEINDSDCRLRSPFSLGSRTVEIGDGD